jgi:hypothetical protein
MNKDLRIKLLDKLKANSIPITKEYILYKDKLEPMEVYRIPTDQLIYNKYNGRILSMVKSFEQQFHPLDPELEADKKTIEKFLWDSKEDRNKTTLKDLERYGQKRVGIVTRDGIIIDGNRRASLLNKLGQEKNSYPVYFNAVILPDTLDDSPQEVMKLETMYQMGEDEKLDYNPIEKYLKCKDLLKVGFTEGSIADMMREKDSRIKEWVSIMKLMDNYLDALGYSGIYTRLDKREGQFVDLNKYLKKYEEGSPAPDWGYTLTDVSDLKAICFDYIRAEYEGKEFRAIALPSRKDSFFCKEQVWRKFREEHFEKIDDINSKEPSVEELKKREPAGDLSKILKVRDEEWQEQSAKLLKGNLNRSQRDLDNINEKDEPRTLLLRAKDTLLSIDTDSPAFHGHDDVPKLISELHAIITDLQQKRR